MLFSKLKAEHFKAFEDEAAIKKLLKGFKNQPIYIADTASKAKPSIYVCDVKRVLVRSNAIDKLLVPKYYRSRIREIRIWFELVSSINEIDADPSLVALLGVPTIYFLDNNGAGLVFNSSTLQRDFRFKASPQACFVLHLSDIHLGSDHAFRYPVPDAAVTLAPTRTLSEVLLEDLREIGALGKVGCVVISGDIVTRGGWADKIEVDGKSFRGLELAKVCLEDLSEKIGVPANLSGQSRCRSAIER
jgi:hypothetical protein